MRAYLFGCWQSRLERSLSNSISIWMANLISLWLASLLTGWQLILNPNLSQPPNWLADDDDDKPEATCERLWPQANVSQPDLSLAVHFC